MQYIYWLNIDDQKLRNNVYTRFFVRKIFLRKLVFIIPGYIIPFQNLASWFMRKPSIFYQIEEHTISSFNSSFYYLLMVPYKKAVKYFWALEMAYNVRKNFCKIFFWSFQNYGTFSSLNSSREVTVVTFWSGGRLWTKTVRRAPLHTFFCIFSKVFRQAIPKHTHESICDKV